MRTSKMTLRPEGMYYYTLLNRMEQTHPKYDEIEARALHYANGFMKEHDILSILQNHPNRKSIANVILTEGDEELRFDHLLLFKGEIIALDVSYADEGIIALEDGDIIRDVDGSAIGNPLQTLRAKALAFETLASEMGWSLPPVKPLVLFVHSETVFSKDAALPDGYIGALDMAKAIIAAVETEVESHGQGTLKKAGEAILDYALKRQARRTVWRDEACADILSGMVMKNVDQLDPPNGWYQIVLDYYILKGDVLEADEAERMMRLFDFSPEQEDSVRRLREDLPKNARGDYLLANSLRMIWGVDSQMEELSTCIANRVYEDLLA